jgi:hypothetical protein
MIANSDEVKLARRRFSVAGTIAATCSQRCGGLRRTSDDYPTVCAVAIPAHEAPLFSSRSTVRVTDAESTPRRLDNAVGVWAISRASCDGAPARDLQVHRLRSWVSYDTVHPVLPDALTGKTDQSPGSAGSGTR